jgi:Family of unknown function (DUF6662)
MMRIRLFAFAAAAAAAVSAVSPASATSRRFTYTYESLVLNKGDVELEPWTTVRNGREDFYRRFDQRIEFETGVSQRLQTAFYFNFSAVAQDTAPDDREVEFEWGGVSNEWKYKLLDPVADPVGMALYFEWGVSPTEAELEFKLILDKRAGDVLVAFNAVVEPEWEYEPEETEREINFEFDLAGAYLFSPSFSLGAEMRNHNAWVPDVGHEYSALFLGPVASYAAESWWASLTVLPQIAKLKGSAADEGNDLVLSDHEKLEVRLIFGVDL